ncbi:MAG: hypothetical protein AAF958_12010 [Planctomycetota bacterium]
MNHLHQWLGIPPEEQPPNHYRLLGVSLFETDENVIDAAADRQLTYLHSLINGSDADVAEALANDVSQARLTLLNSSDRAEYDAGLKARLATRETRAALETPAGGRSSDNAAPAAGTPMQPPSEAVSKSPTPVATWVPVTSQTRTQRTRKHGFSGLQWAFLLIGFVVPTVAFCFGVVWLRDAKLTAFKRSTDASPPTLDGQTPDESPLDATTTAGPSNEGTRSVPGANRPRPNDRGAALGTNQVSGASGRHGSDAEPFMGADSSATRPLGDPKMGTGTMGTGTVGTGTTGTGTVELAGDDSVPSPAGSDAADISTAKWLETPIDGTRTKRSWVIQSDAAAAEPEVDVTLEFVQYGQEVQWTQRTEPQGSGYRVTLTPGAGPPNAGPPNADPPNADPPNADPPNADPPNADPNDHYQGWEITLSVLPGDDAGTWRLQRESTWRFPAGKPVPFSKDKLDDAAAAAKRFALAKTQSATQAAAIAQGWKNQLAAARGRLAPKSQAFNQIRLKHDQFVALERQAEQQKLQALNVEGGFQDFQRRFEILQSQKIRFRLRPRGDLQQ